jgi:hypothetical protein
MKATESIPSLPPNVTREEAVRLFTASSPSSVYWRMRRGPVQRIAEAYLPYRIYRVRYPLAGAMRTQLLAIDAVDGSLDLFEFATAPNADELLIISTSNAATPMLSETRSEQFLREKALRVIFQQGFFRLRSLQLEVQRLPGEIYLPYWLGFYGSEQRVHCRVLDAVRRRVEGAKASALFEAWLAA